MPRARPLVARKSIFDPVHGVVVVTGAALKLIGHPAFQRLWGIRQTGFAHLVFPGANHTRLEHSLGVYWVARTMPETIGLPEEEATIAAVGGLLHDLGHGPFSHTLDPSMREVLGYGHESVSRAWITGERESISNRRADAGPTIPEILRSFDLDEQRVASLVDPSGSARRPSIVGAILHGAIDADRIDYLQRDAHYTGVAHGAIDAVRLLDTVREDDGRLVFAEKGRSAVEGFLVGRALMYSSVYYHKTVRAAEVMAQSAVERSPGYPESARPLFDATDAELLYRLGESGESSARRVRALLERRLFKRVFGLKEVEGTDRRRWLALARDPKRRRASEDRISERIGAPPGSVLFDFAGLQPRESPGSEWSAVGVLEAGQVVYPFKKSSPWSEFAARPPALWAVSAYADPAFRSGAERYFRRNALEL